METNEIPTLNDFHVQLLIREKFFFGNNVETRCSAYYEVNKALNDKIAVFVGNIARLNVDAIVNAANSSLTKGGGVNGQIHLGAGDALLAECATLSGGCDTGDVKVTRAYKLPAKYVIHTVGPVGGHERAADLLRSCYTTSLTKAVELNCRTIVI